MTDASAHNDHLSIKTNPSPAPKVALFVTCLVDLYRPEIGFACLDLLTAAGCQVSVPTQTCCGQPGFNNGDQTNARSVALQNIERFEGYDYLVAPSGSCAAMIKVHYPQLFEQGSENHKRAQNLANRTFELTQFLVDELKVNQEFFAHAFNANTSQTQSPAPLVTYHDSCSGLREMGIKEQPRALLQKSGSAQIIEHQEAETCCGFGGTFCVKYSDISDRMVSQKLNHAQATGASTLVAGDLGCILNMQGKVEREKAPLQVKHVAEVLQSKLTSQIK